MFSIGKHFSDVWSTPKVHCGPICGWVFFYQCRRAQLSRLCLPTTGMDFQGDRTMVGTVTWKLSPPISQKTHRFLFFSTHTPTLFCKYKRSCAMTAMSVSVDSGRWFFFFVVVLGGFREGKERRRVLKSYMEGNINSSVATAVSFLPQTV